MYASFSGKILIKWIVIDSEYVEKYSFSKAAPASARACVCMCERERARVRERERERERASECMHIAL
jgi:hypothetical protein